MTAWKPPVLTGLDHSTAIFVPIKSEEGGNIGIALSEGHTHFREWQEDNGVADVHGGERVEKVVDGACIKIRESIRLTSPPVSPRQCRPHTVESLGKVTKRELLGDPSESKDCQPEYFDRTDSTGEGGTPSDDPVEARDYTPQTAEPSDATTGAHFAGNSPVVWGKSPTSGEQSTDAAKKQSPTEGEISTVREVIPHRPSSSKPSRPSGPGRNITLASSVEVSGYVHRTWLNTVPYGRRNTPPMG